MNRWIIFALSLAVLAIDCSNPKPKLHVYTWADYIDPQLIKTFEKEFNCDVVIDTFDSNEALYAKLKVAPQGYDVAMPSSYMASVLYQQGFLEKLDHSKLPNLKNIDTDYLNLLAIDKTMDYSVPYMLSSTGIGYLKDKVKTFIPSWGMFDDKNLAGRMSLLNDMREAIGAALKYLGYSLNTTNDDELAAAEKVLLRWKKNIAKFDSEQYKLDLASGELLLTQGYSGDVLQAIQENPEIQYALPKEGTSFACDDFVILKTSKAKALAYAFINFLHDPPNAAANTIFIRYRCPNKASYELLPTALQQNHTLFPPPEILAKCEVIRDLGSNNVKYVKIWDAVRNAR